MSTAKCLCTFRANPEFVRVSVRRISKTQWLATIRGRPLGASIGRGLQSQVIQEKGRSAWAAILRALEHAKAEQILGIHLNPANGQRYKHPYGAAGVRARKDARALRKRGVRKT